MAFENSKYIWLESESENSFLEAYSSFNYDLGNVKINLSCDSDYTLFINGKYVSSNQYGDFEGFKCYDTIDITDFLVKGKNHFACLVWHFGKDTQRYKKFKAGLIFEILNEENELLVSCEDILVRESKAYTSGFERKISSQLGFSYRYDAGKEDNWTIGEGDGFKKAHPVSKKSVFYPRPIKGLRLGDFVSGKVIYESKNRILVDLGKEYVGLLSFVLISNGKEEINISYGEHLVNGFVPRKIGDRDFSIDYIAKEGKNEFTHYMLRLACRYLEINTQGKVFLEKIGLIPQYYPANERKIDFLSGDEKRIYDACVNTLKLCMMEHYVDCPWREQCLYAFDSRNQMLCGYFAFENGNFEYARANLLLASKDERSDNLLSICFPCGIDLTIPSFSLHYITALYEYLIYSKDKALIYEVENKAKSLINAFLNNMENGLINSFLGDCYWNFYDWSRGHDGGDKSPSAILNLLAYRAINHYKEICDTCSLIFDFSEALAILKESIRSSFLIKENGLITYSLENREVSTLACSLALLTDIFTKEENEKIASYLTGDDITEISLSVKCFTYDGLLNQDVEKYKSFVLSSIKSDYLKMVETGTVWETIEGASAFDNAGSLCHGWSSIPIYYYHKLLIEKGMLQ
ncbi:MAG: hypothetical protein IJW54_06545 [Clostridia bacterium]|nr:hypothetical protein [Clostridia bacterium]